MASQKWRLISPGHIFQALIIQFGWGGVNFSLFPSWQEHGFLFSFWKPLGEHFDAHLRHVCKFTSSSKTALIFGDSAKSLPCRDASWSDLMSNDGMLSDAQAVNSSPQSRDVTGTYTLSHIADVCVQHDLQWDTIQPLCNWGLCK